MILKFGLHVSFLPTKIRCSLLKPSSGKHRGWKISYFHYKCSAVQCHTVQFPLFHSTQRKKCSRLCPTITITIWWITLTKLTSPSKRTLPLNSPKKKWLSCNHLSLLCNIALIFILNKLSSHDSLILMNLKAAGDKLLMNKFIRQNFGGGLTLKIFRPVCCVSSGNFISVLYSWTQNWWF